MWLYKGKEIHNHDDLLPGCTDFVYMIEYTNGQKYIGKKTVQSLRKKKPTLKQLKIRKNFSRKEMTYLPFVDYKGSHNVPDDLIIDYKEILYQCSTKRAATYLEVALMCHHNSIFDDTYLNESISGVHYSNVLDGLLS